jgi:hypothetical protein
MTAPGYLARPSDQAADGLPVAVDPSTASFRALALQVRAMGLLDRRPGPTRHRPHLLVTSYHRQTARKADARRAPLTSTVRKGGDVGLAWAQRQRLPRVRGWITSTSAANSRSITHRVTLPADQRGIWPVRGPRARGSGGGTSSVL